MQAAAGEREIGAFMEGVTHDFVGNQGMDRAALHNMLRGQVLSRSGIAVVTGPLDVKMKGDHASVRFTAMVTGGNRRLLPDSAQAYAISSGWRLEEGEWCVYYAEWEPKL